MSNKQIKPGFVVLKPFQHLCASSKLVRISEILKQVQNDKWMYFCSLFAYLLICLFAYSSKAFAQLPSPTTNLLSVTPSIIELDFATDRPEATLTYTNTTNDTIELNLSAKDFTELEDGYKISYLEGKEAQNYQYSLSSWIHFDNTDVTIPAHESKDVTIFIDKDKLTTGGHYATILAEWVQQGGTGPVNLKAILSSLLFVRTNHGDEREEGQFDEMNPVQSFWSFPEMFTVKFKNSGNVQLVPHGMIQIKDAWGNIAGQGYINDGSSITLPETIRRYDTYITADPQFIIPGYYKADAYIHFGKADKVIKAQTAFFTFGSFNPAMIILLIIAISIISRFRPGKKKVFREN